MGGLCSEKRDPRGTGIRLKDTQWSTRCLLAFQLRCPDVGVRSDTKMAPVRLLPDSQPPRRVQAARSSLGERIPQDPEGNAQRRCSRRHRPSSQPPTPAASDRKHRSPSPQVLRGAHAPPRAGSWASRRRHAVTSPADARSRVRQRGLRPSEFCQAIRPGQRGPGGGSASTGVGGWLRGNRVLSSACAG